MNKRQHGVYPLGLFSQPFEPSFNDTKIRLFLIYPNKKENKNKFVYIKTLIIFVPPIKNTMNTEFNIQTKNVQIGADLFSIDYYLYHGSTYVAKISKPLIPDEDEKNHIIFDVLGECEDRAYCIPHEVIKKANHEAVNLLQEYLKGREIIKQKSGWCTKTQYWHTYTLIENDFESIVS